MLLYAPYRDSFNQNPRKCTHQGPPKLEDRGDISDTFKVADKGPVKMGGEAPRWADIHHRWPSPNPTKVVQKIEKGEYVDFTDLLPKKPSTEEPTISELAEEGIVVVTQSRHMKGQKKPIQDIATWVEAFLTFATVRNRKYPAHTNDLLAYGALVVRGARDYKGPVWLSYDFQYRRLAAARGNFGDWGKKDVSLWSDTVCKQEAAPQTQHPRSSEHLVHVHVLIFLQFLCN